MSACPELETLFDELAAGGGPAVEHAKECAACAAVLEEHRQLEKDLFRLADPLPPPDFVQQVMERVANAPAPARIEWRSFGAILATAVAAGLGTLLVNVGVGGVGVRLATTLVSLRDFAVGLSRGLSVVWSTQSGPLTFAVVLTLFFSIVLLRRLTQNEPVRQRVSP